MSVGSPRRAAYDVLHEIGASDAYANLALGDVLHRYELDQRDAGFVTDLVNGTIRHRMTLDAVLQLCSNRPLDKIDPRVLDVLRMGAYQLLISSVDPHAAVHTSVDLVVSVAGPGPKGFANAVLRAVSRRSMDEWLPLAAGDPLADADRFLSVSYSHPPWIVAALRDALGRDHADELASLLKINNDPPPVTLVARPGRSTVAELVAAGGHAATLSPLAVTAPSGRVGDIDAVRQRRAGVQDEGSQLVALAIAHADVSGRDSEWLDLCAGPGGKIALLAALAAQQGAGVAGIELHPHRARLVTQQAGGAAGFIGVVAGDARKPPLRVPAGGADRVLLDVPCTGLGVLRRRPEIRWRRQPSDIPQLTRLQTDLLNSAIDLTRPGGVIGYVTCSPHLAETDRIVRGVARRRSDVAIEDARPLFPGVPELGDGPFVRLWPHVHNTDGMFFALMRRTG